MGHIFLTGKFGRLSAILAVSILSAIAIAGQQVVDLPQIVTEPIHTEYVFTQNPNQPAIINVTSSNKGVATARAYRADRVQITGVGPGEATVEFFDSAQRVQYRVRVSVQSSAPAGNAGLDKTRERLPDVNIILNETANVRSLVNGANNINSVSTSNKGVATARTNTANTIQIYAVGLGDTFINFDDRGRHFQVHVWVRKAGDGSNGGGVGGGSGNGGGNGVEGTGGPFGGGGKGRIDACLVGTWTAESVSNQFTHWDNGGAGIVLTIKANGQVTVNYDAMEPNRKNTQTTTWRGSASGRLITKPNHQLSVSQVDESNIDTTYVTNGAPTYNGHLQGLGNVLQSAFDYNYTCDRSTLTLQSNAWNSSYRKVP